MGVLDGIKKALNDEPKTVQPTTKVEVQIDAFKQKRNNLKERYNEIWEKIVNNEHGVISSDVFSDLLNISKDAIIELKHEGEYMDKMYEKAQEAFAFHASYKEMFEKIKEMKPDGIDGKPAV